MVSWKVETGEGGEVAISMHGCGEKEKEKEKGKNDKRKEAHSVPMLLLLLHSLENESRDQWQ
jgi:hypothetical protein